MRDLPEPILNHLYTHIIATYSPAYLLVDNEGRVTDWGGPLAAYGITDLRQGHLAEEQVIFLEGLLPLEEPSLHLPFVQTQGGVASDLYIFQSEAGHWILLLDVSEEERQRRRMQQYVNDLSLLRQKIAKVAAQYLGKDVAETLAQRLQALGWEEPSDS